MANNELFRTATIRHKGKDIPVHGARLRRDLPRRQPWEWRTILLAAIIFFGGLAVLIIIYLFIQSGSV